LIQEQRLRRNIDSQNPSPRFDYCASAASRRVLQQYLGLSGRTQGALSFVDAAGGLANLAALIIDPKANVIAMRLPDPDRGEAIENNQRKTKENAQSDT
jgi:hypothetical protein